MQSVDHMVYSSTSSEVSLQKNIEKIPATEKDKIIAEESEMLRSVEVETSTVEIVKNELDNDGLYLITGGLGSLGIEVCSYLQILIVL